VDSVSLGDTKSTTEGPLAGGCKVLVGRLITEPTGGDR
jgi:hypothetical protein